MSDVNVAEAFIREAANEPFKNCFKGRPVYYRHVLSGLGMERDLENRWVTEADIEEQKRRYDAFTYCEACQKLIVDSQNGWEAEASVIEAFADIYRDIKRRQEERSREIGIRAVSPYVWAKEIGCTGTELCFFLVGNINMKEYFQALSFVTRNEEDARIPERLPPCEDQTMMELLEQADDGSDTFLERVRILLIEPFARICGA